jgi:predicted CoA-binding protein
MPLTVAVVGASPDRTKYGNKAVRAYLQQGHTVYPVHPREPIVEGLPAYPTVADIPTDHIDRVTMYVPPQIGLQVVESLGGKSIGEVWFNPGSESEALVQRVRELGIRPVVACSILAVGLSPDSLDA